MGCGASKDTRTKTTTPRKRKHGGQGKAGKTGNAGERKRQPAGGLGKQTPKEDIREQGWKKRIRENLRDAAAGDDIPRLDRCIVIFENNRMQDGGDLTEARHRMDYLCHRKDIRDACMRNHPKVLQTSIEKVENSPYCRQLNPWLQKAHHQLRQQNETTRVKHDIPDIEQSTVSEIRSYTHPPTGVQEVMTATHLLLGYKEEDILDWNDICALMQRYGRHRTVREVKMADTRYLNDHSVLRAKTYLNKHSLDEVRDVSAGAAAFHVWCAHMINKYEGDRKGSGGGNVSPREANLARNKHKPAPVPPADKSKQGGKQQNQKDKKQQQNQKQKQQQQKNQKQANNTSKDNTKQSKTNKKG